MRGKHRAEMTTREMRMIELRNAGATLQEIANQYSITRQRVQMILKACAERVPPGVEDERKQIQT